MNNTTNSHMCVEKIAVIDHNEIYTYRDLADMQREFSNHIESRTLIFIICENTIECLIGYIGSIENKTVPLMLSKMLPREKYVDLIKEYRPEYIWCNASADVKSVVASALVDEVKKADKIYKLKNYELYHIYYKHTENTPKMYEELALLLPTSGSTGSPKYVRISYENLASNTKAITECLKIFDKDVTITTLPMHYTYGLSVINTYLYVGATIVMTEDSIIKGSLWEKVRDYKVTSISGVPYTYDIMRKLRLDKRELPHLKTLTQAGGRLSEATRQYLMAYCEREGKRLIVMYGQTEATARISYMPYEALKQRETSIGVPIPDGKLWIADEKGEMINDSDKEGQLVYEGDNVTLGYAHNRDDLSKEDERNKLLYTGDYGYVDSQGYYYITDRKDRQAKLFGNRIDLKSLEEGICARYGGECVCGVRDNIVYIYHTEKDKQEWVCSYVKELLNIPNKNISYSYVEELTRNEAGKVMRMIYYT